MINQMKKVVYGFVSVVLLFPTGVFAATMTEGFHVDFGIGAPKGVGDNHSTLASTINDIVLWLLGFVGALAVLMIIVAGIMYLTSGGDEGRVEKAKQWLIYAIVGLIVALLGWVIVSTVITNL